MNNYDDIKRFKDKLNLEGIDYKEIVENRPNNTANNWAIIKQVATADEPFHPLEHGHSTQPTPAPVSHQEFSAASAVQPARQSASHNNQGQGILHALDETSAPAQEPTFASPLLSALSKVMPLAAGAVSGIAAETRSALDHGAAAHNPFAARPAGATAPGGLGGATLFTTASRQDFAPEPAAAPRSPLTPRPPVAPLSSAPTRAPSPAQPDNARRFNKLFNRKSHLPAGITPSRDMPLSLLLENIALCR